MHFSPKAPNACPAYIILVTMFIAAVHFFMQNLTICETASLLPSLSTDVVINLLIIVMIATKMRS